MPTLRLFTDAGWVSTQLDQQGFRGPQRSESVQHFTRLAEVLAQRGCSTDAETLGFFVPGRIEVIGKHTDYAGGSSIVCAVDRGFHVLALPSASNALYLVDAFRGLEASFTIHPDLHAHVSDWSLYPRTVARRLARNFEGCTRGGTIAFHNNLPAASGMSSSSAFIITFYLALKAFNNLQERPLFKTMLPDTLSEAHYCGCIENGPDYGLLKGDMGVGTLGGCQDQIAILCAKPHHLRHFGYLPPRALGEWPLPVDHTFVIGSSGATADKTGEAQHLYNRVSKLARALASYAAQESGQPIPHLGAVAQRYHVPIPPFTQVLDHATEEFPLDALEKRWQQFFYETNVLIPEAISALSQGDVTSFGKHIRTSHEHADQLLGNQIPETNALVASAYAKGALAASAFGAGFGGAVWALVPNAEASRFLNVWASHYTKAFPSRTKARFFRVEAGPPAFRLA